MPNPTTPSASLSNLDELIDRPVVIQWLAWGLFWLMIGPSIGALISTQFVYPDVTGTWLPLQFGRLRPIHVNTVVYGAFSGLFIGCVQYLLPRLTGVRIPWPRVSRLMVWIWNLGILFGDLSLAAGYNQGLEVAEYPLIIDIFAFVGLLTLTIQFLLAIGRRTHQDVYVSLWYLMGAFVWTSMNEILGNFIVPYYIPGINNAAFHGLYLHYTVGLWLTPAGYVLIYYFLPASVKNPIYSHKLSMIGFWSLALFYPFVGIHHYLYSPIADWAETLAIITSMLLIIPVWTVLQNFFGTMIGRWHTFSNNLPAKFLIIGSIMYLLGCFQGSTEALRSIQKPTHFTDFVISHSHLTVFGTFVIWAIGGTLYVWPKMFDRELYSFKLGNWSFWLITIGISTMGVVLSAQGLQQGFMWMNGTEWIDSLVPMKPFWIVRTLAGISMDMGMSLIVFNLMMTALSRDDKKTSASGAVVGGAAS
ncbi:MAG: cbb3-type cytochrome c oxidase subunit I [Gammaproteobacteria bacterium]